MSESNQDAFLRELCGPLLDRLGGPLLAIDTSETRATLALAARDGHGNIGCWEETLSALALPSDALMARLATLLAESQVAAHAVKAIAVGLGPGSFTGLRVGLSSAKGLAFGADQAQLFGGSSLQLLAASAQMDGPVLAVRDARRDAFFVGLYEVDAHGHSQVVWPDALYARAQLQEALASRTASGRLAAVVGDAAGQFSAYGQAHQGCKPRAALLWRQLQARMLRGPSDDLASLTPVYLRASAAEDRRQASPAEFAL